MRRSWQWWAVLSALGLVAILLPDGGPRLLSLSHAHGPALLDGIGELAALQLTAAMRATFLERSMP